MNKDANIPYSAFVIVLAVFESYSYFDGLHLLCNGLCCQFQSPFRLHPVKKLFLHNAIIVVFRFSFLDNAIIVVSRFSWKV